ncbi:hypothetical protein K1T71_006312 [Dendrolimus kikuchii]|uniref:Uncharacterized protein n=1 Tax=Dendrolimus kikuchii TaxID=765133 RepID=A0ACC1D3G7_9NEOP|nr:hypothetical protein K1T71_006312 [Dendrolimus kikuchii]
MQIRLIVILATMILSAYAQDCKVGGKKCADHEQCCGGCCFDGFCINTYRSCLSSLDVCENHVCVGEENCVVYIPPQCPGCEPVPVCKS